MGLNDKRLYSRLSLLLLSVFCLEGAQAKPKETGLLDSRKFNREEMKVINLKYGQGSAAFYMLESIRRSHESARDLGKALQQMTAVEKDFAKSKGRPDDTFFPESKMKLALAEQKAEELESLSQGAYDSMKTDITQALVSH